MNSDPYDSAAWRAFGMLDADEATVFDDAMREDPALRRYSHEMDRLSAAIAASTAMPIEPEAAQLEQILSRLHLTRTKRAAFWLAIAGWAAAAVLGLLLFINRTDRQTAAISPPAASSREIDITAAKPAATMETKRLVQEIDVLRENLEKFQHRDRVLFQEVPGMALPVVMTLNPPGAPAEDSPALARDDHLSPITTMLGDAVRAMNAAETDEQDSSAMENEDSIQPQEQPSAISIYDAARDSGTLVVHDLATAADGENYNLWVIPETGGKPIYVGSLPENSATGADSFDFSLGSTMVLPTGFMLTRDPLNAAASPTEKNIILQGPSMPAR
jgi:hypothetical protein